MKKEDLENIYVPTQHNELLQRVVDTLNGNEEVRSLWKIINVNAIDRLGFSDHGIVHFQIVANSALRIARILTKNKVDLSVKKDFGLTNDHSEVIIYLASVLHDLGMTIHRKGHEEFSLFMVNTLLREILDFIPVEERMILIAETLHAIIGHRNDGDPYTLEAGIVRIADALDMAQGRAREAFKYHGVNIHNLSEESIEKVEILEQEQPLIQIKITMQNSAGIFGIDQLLRKKIKGSGMEKYIQVKAFIEKDNEKKMLSELTIDF